MGGNLKFGGVENKEQGSVGANQALGGGTNSPYVRTLVPIIRVWREESNLPIIRVWREETNLLIIRVSREETNSLIIRVWREETWRGMAGGNKKLGKEDWWLHL